MDNHGLIIVRWTELIHRLLPVGQALKVAQNSFHHLDFDGLL